MRFIEQEIAGVFVIEPEPYGDKRGLFRRFFCQKEFEAHGLTNTVAQMNVSENPLRHTLRGFHYQKHPHWEAKTLSCFQGKAFDVVIDLRPESPTFAKWIAVELSPDNRRSVHVPHGCANAFLTLEPGTVVHYYVSTFYAPQAERGIRYNDPAFGVRWPVEPAVISDKDRNHPDFDPKAV
jgi:dTDP-4-dehydrorhamnose 3,5-epimerase